MTELTPFEVSFSPSRFVPNAESPEQAMGKWIEFQQQCFNENLNKYKVDFDLNAMIFGIQITQMRFKNVHIFVHGGYWQECSRKTTGSILNSFLTSNIAVFMVGYTLATQVPLTNLIAQIEEAIKDISRKFPHAKLTISGHSAGAHLAAKAIENPDIGKLVHSATLICGVYDLVPLVGTYIGRGINLTHEMAEQTSVSWEKVAKFKGKVLCIQANFDAPSLQKQSKEFAKKLSTKKTEGLQVESFDEDHFSIISALNDPQSKVSKCIIDFVLQ
ncbi:hypothetical protein M3Y97_00127100 [Aphelenchoides bicaudatus]|nr:hypothetical protein M3Y97_00127100 [Aphelenchoides bicaudatus]